MNKLCLIVLLLLALTSCQNEPHGEHADDHGHSHESEAAADHGNGHESEAADHGHDQESEAADDHGHDHESEAADDHSHEGEAADDHGHDHESEAADDHSHESEAADDHGHGHESEAADDHGGGEMHAVQISRWNDDMELFIEHPPFVVGVPTRLVTHVTHLQQWQARTTGPLYLIFSRDGERDIHLTDDAPARDGIYLPHVTFPKRGVWDMKVRIPLADGYSSMMLSGIQVFSSEAEASQQPHEEEAAATISFLKEQQWRMPFASEQVDTQNFRANLRANGTLVPHAGGEVVISAPQAGRLLLSATALPHVGTRIEKGQVLAYIIPRLEGGYDPANLKLAVEKARLVHEFANKERQRVKGQVDALTLPANRLNAADLELATSAAELKAAEERQRQFASQSKSESNGTGNRLALISPIAGTVVEANATAGAQVAADEHLFTIVDLSRLWLSIDIPESDIARVSNASGVWFEVEGIPRVFEIDTHTGGRLIALGGRVHPTRRTVPLIFEVPNPDELLKVGMFAQASVLSGEQVSGVAIPSKAVLEENGLPVAYVQAGGESFERRALTLGIRDGNRVQVLAGISAGERVVTQGAYQIRLAASSTAIPAHGHEH